MKRQIFNVQLLISALAGILALASPAAAQPLDTLLAEAFAHNAMLRSASSLAAAAAYRADAAGAWPAPTLSVEFSQVPTGSANILNDAISNNIGISQMFMLGGKLGSMADAARWEHEAARAGMREYRTDLTARVKMGYFTLWQVDRKIDIEQSTLSLLRELLSSASAAFQTQRFSQADLLMLQSAIASAEARVIVLQRERNSEAASLAALLGRDLRQAAIVPDSLLGLPDAGTPPDSLERIFGSSNPLLAKMDAMTRMNASEARSAAAGNIPDLMLQFMIMRMPQGMILTANQPMLTAPMTDKPWMYSIMASVTLPFLPWSSPAADARRQEYEARAEASTQERLEMERRMKARIAELTNKLESSIQLARLYERSILPSYRKAVEARLTEYRTGVVPLSQVLETQRMMLMESMNGVMARADAWMALAELEMMIGRQL